MFKVAARTVLELGAELISSDAIAIYELVKNAFDAGSPSVCVDIDVVLRRSGLEKLLEGLNHSNFDSVEDYIAELKHQVRDHSKPEVSHLFVVKATPSSLAVAADLLRTCYIQQNLIKVTDSGSGMSLDTLRKAFLTIGTANRVTGKRTRQDGRRILGEKGVGRLSSMRLGSKLSVRTAREIDRNWSLLDIDWDDFGAEPELMIEDIIVDARPGPRKEDPGARGTTLVIQDLVSDWSLANVQSMAAGEFSRLVDPFQPSSHGFPIELRFNGNEVPVRRISSLLFKNAHGHCRAEYRIEPQIVAGIPNDTPRLIADFEYRLYNERQHFDIGGSELQDAVGSGVPGGALVELGPFSFEFYWYNRRLLKEIDGIGKSQDVKKLVNTWSGGLMVFRDGFRVNPYGAEGDDWLDLNSQAFKSSGYLLNTDQIIGRVRITGLDNPKLVDQTNREGLRDNFEKAALVSILRKFLTGYLKDWMDDVNASYQGLKQLDLGEIEASVANYDQKVQTNLKELREQFPGEDKKLTQLVKSFSDMKLAFHQAKGMVDSSERDRQRLLELAGIGLMVEVVAHELARATKHTLDLLKSAQKRAGLPVEMRMVLENLQTQLTTIERRLRVLDPLSISGRQRRSEFDLVELIRSTFEGRVDQLESLGIRWSFSWEEGRERPIFVKAERGMVIQIIENLLSNSLHWLERQKSANSRFRPEIRVALSSAHGGSFVFTDNGPGIAPQAAERVFEAFFSTRGEGGRGLGLFISRENARHFGGDLVLLQDRRIHRDRLNSLQFSMINPKGNAS